MQYKNNKTNIFSVIFFNPFRIIAILFVGILLITLIYLIVLGFTQNIFGQNQNLNIKGVNLSKNQYYLKKLNQISELSTVEMIFAKEIETKITFDNLELFGGINLNREASQKLNVEGNVKSGLNLSKINAQDIEIDENHKTIKIKLPQSEITNVSLNEEKTKILRDSNSLALAIETLQPNRKLEVQNLIKQEVAKVAKSQLVSASCDEGIMNKSQEKAEIILTNLFEFSGFEKVEIVKNTAITC
jgi:hypothetical protein